MEKEITLVNIIFDAARGDCPIESREARTGEPIGALPGATRSGYRFEGWYLAGQPVTAETVLEDDCDVTLTAHWVKREKSAVRTMFRRQKTACWILAGVILLLSITLAVVNNLVQIYGVTDTYVTEDGTVHTDKYYARKQKDGTYALYDKKKNLMPQNEDGYYIAVGGNQYEVDPETGDCTLYAAVDYDSEGGESLGFSDRIMMFPQIQQKYVYSIEVENEYGTYCIYRNESGTVLVKDVVAAYDPTQYASLCVSCGYMLTMQKLDFSADNVYVPRLADGSVDYSQYGLAELTDGQGNVTYKPAKYTIIAADKTSVDSEGKYVASDTQYTVEVGSVLLSGGGYYVKLVDRDAVYIVSNSIAETVLQPVESMVTAGIVYPMSMSTYSMPHNFSLTKLDFGDGIETLDLSALNETTVVAFTYQDLEERSNTLLSSVPYVSLEQLMSGYTLNSNSISTMLSNLYQMEFLGCRKLGVDKDTLKEYGFVGEVYCLSYIPAMIQQDASGSNTVVYPSDYYDLVLISQKNENGNYYVASTLYDMIVEVDPYYLVFLDWEQNEWYEKSVFQNNIAFMKDMEFSVGDKVYRFVLDNSATVQTAESVSSGDLKIYCDQYHDGKADEHLLDYSFTYSYPDDKGGTKTDTITGLSNFRKFYTNLLYTTIEGDLDEDEFQTNMGMTVEEFLRDHGNETDAKLVYSAEDFAGATDSEGEPFNQYYHDYELPNNTRDVIIRFYRYSERKLMVTVETLQRDASGNLQESDPTNVKAVFYVSTSHIKTLAQNAQDLLDAVRIVSVA